MGTLVFLWMFYNMWCVVRFGTICTILKTWKNTHGGVLILVSEVAGFTKINIPPWVFFTCFKLCKWYQIAQRTTYALLFLNDNANEEGKYFSNS